MTYYESTNLKKETKKYRKALPCFSILKKRDRLSANKQQSFFTNLKSHFKVMYLCNYNQKNVRKNTFLWAIGKIPLFYNRQIKKFPTEKQNVSLKHILT